MRARLLARSVGAALLLLLVSACGDDGDPIGLPGIGPPPSPSQPTIGLMVSGAVNVPRGSTAQVTVTVSRVTDFNGLVTLSAEGLPAGVSAAFAPAIMPNVTTGNSTLTLTAAPGATLGTVPVTVRATASGVADASVQLDVGVIP